MDSDDERIWRLPSNDGWQETTFAHEGIFKHAGLEYVLMSVRTKGEYWSQAEEVFGNLDLAPDHELVLPQVVVLREELKGLRGRLEDWLHRPRRIAARLGRLRLDLRPRKGMLATTDKPLCNLSYKTPRVVFTWKYVVDQSCIRIAMNGLGGALRFRR